jgi:uncharacterized protein YwgA
MDRNALVMAALAAGGHDATYPPAQVQKLLFLIDREIPDTVGGPHFQFAPYDYGPFDRSLYDSLDELESEGKVSVSSSGKYRRYGLTNDGWMQGQAALAEIRPEARKFIEEAAAWVNGLSFAQLVSAIYKRYPDMKANSIFRG